MYKVYENDISLFYLELFTFECLQGKAVTVNFIVKHICFAEKKGTMKLF